MATRNVASIFVSGKVPVFPAGFTWLSETIFDLATQLKKVLALWFDSSTPAALKAHNKIHRKEKMTKKERRLAKELKKNCGSNAVVGDEPLIVDDDSGSDSGSTSVNSDVFDSDESGALEIDL
jgi:hypothetical protein